MHPIESSTATTLLGAERSLVVVRGRCRRRLSDGNVGVVALAGCLATSALLVAGGGERRPLLSPAAMTAMVAIVSWWARPVTSLLVAAIAWLCLDGFVTNPLGQLGWHGVDDVWRAVVLAGAGLGTAWVHAGVIRLGGRVLIQEFRIEEPHGTRVARGGIGR